MQTQPRTGSWLWLGTLCLAGASFLTLAAGRVNAQPANEDRLKSESPYFFVKSDDPTVDRLPLKSTDVDVKISGVIADVTVVQRYRNEGTRAIEARYVFPGSTKAAVHGMSVRLADRLITASIREKQQARVEYDAAKKEGKTAALLEQHRPNVFQMNVANILPGDDVKVELRYTELLVPQAGNYQFVFTTVVGPRYNSPQSGQAASSSWAAQPYHPEGTSGNSTFDMRVALSAPMGLKEVRSTSHELNLQREREDFAVATLKQNGARADNRDFILDYRLAGDRVESGVMLFKGADENFFLAMVEPPKQVAATAISPRDYIFVVDISGSMHGFPLDTAKVMLAELIGGLRPSDTFNVMLFSGSNRMLSPHSVPATRANIEQALRTIQQMGGGGGTELLPALRHVYAEPKAADVSRTVVLVTDGYVMVEHEAFELVRKNLSRANVFAFGIGSSVNRHLMEGLARAGMGEPFIITQPSEAAAQAKRFRQMIESPVLTNVKARFEGLDVYDVEPAQLPDVLGERPVILFGKWRGEAKGQLVIEGNTAQGEYRRSLPVGDHVRTDTSALRHLWARHRIQSLTDQEALEGGDRLAKRITGLGLQYSLLTQYTSFIAVDHVVRHVAQDGVTVDQPLPLPQGVSNNAIGATLVGTAVPSTPEPETWAAMAVVISMLAMLARRARRRNLARFTA